MATQDSPSNIDPATEAPVSPQRKPSTKKPSAKKPSSNKPAANKPAKQAKAAMAMPVDDDSSRGGGLRKILRSFGACTFSTIFHMVLLVALGMLIMDDATKQELTEIVASRYEEELDEEEVLKVELEKQIEAAESASFEVMSASMPVGAAVGGASGDGARALDKKALSQLGDVNVKVGPPQLFMPSGDYMIKDVPDGARGDERFIVNNVDQALSQITRELLGMLEKGNLLVIWAFDMSQSMEDERQEIRDRITKVYHELGLTGRARNGRMTTAVTSYGGNFFVNTNKGPTSNMEEIRAAINSVQNDPSGLEYMCQAVGEAINRHRDYCKKQKRQMALVMLTDESGDPKNNNMFLERAIAEAKQAKCRVYALGRESVFGYPYARMRWIHPQTGHHHWLLVDRGPETPFAEQLQTNGFRRRWDAFSSGFGPYEQTRMCRETGGIFFMMPGQDRDIVAGDKRVYELEAMRSYKPDLRSKVEAFAERDTYPLRTFLWQVVSDLNPLESAQKARDLEIRMTYSLNPQQFLQEKQREQIKARQYLNYLAAAEKILVDNKRHREQEVSPRWQANYDLILAQIVTYQVRIYEYGVYLDYFVKNPIIAPPTKAPNLKLVHWDIHTRGQTFAEDTEAWPNYPDREKALQYIARSKQLLAEVSKNHPGTPWDARAKRELSRGYGVHLRPDYHGPPRPYTGTAPRIPVPKL